MTAQSMEKILKPRLVVDITPEHDDMLARERQKRDPENGRRVTNKVLTEAALELLKRKINAGEDYLELVRKNGGESGYNTA